MPHKLSPVIQGVTSDIVMPASSQIVGHRSIVETGISIVSARILGAEIINGTRADPSKNDILNHSPRSPNISP